MVDTAADWNSQQSLHARGIITVFGEINTEICERVVEFVLAHNLIKTKVKNLNLVINSEGGSLVDAFAVIDVIKHSAIPVHTLGLGQISSAALMIFMSGHAGHRTITANTSILSHQWHSTFEGKMHELIHARTDQELTQNRVLEHYRNHSTLSTDQIQNLLLPAHDVFLSADQAVQYGIADRIQ